MRTVLPDLHLALDCKNASIAALARSTCQALGGGVERRSSRSGGVAVVREGEGQGGGAGVEQLWCGTSSAVEGAHTRSEWAGL